MSFFKWHYTLFYFHSFFFALECAEWKKEWKKTVWLYEKIKYEIERDASDESVICCRVRFFLPSARFSINGDCIISFLTLKFLYSRLPRSFVPISCGSKTDDDDNNSSSSNGKSRKNHRNLYIYLNAAGDFPFQFNLFVIFENRYACQLKCIARNNETDSAVEYSRVQ